MRSAGYAMKEYRQTSVDAGAAYADPHALISMLFNALQERIAVARGALVRKAHADKGIALGRAIDIVGYLQSCLDSRQGGEIAENLDRLYTYIIERLFHCGAHNDPAALDEVSGLIGQIKEAWDAVRDLGGSDGNSSRVTNS